MSDRRHARRVRPGAVAGTWYPGTAASLTHAVDRLLAGADETAGDVSGDLVALIAPHAGLKYSVQSPRTRIGCCAGACSTSRSSSDPRTSSGSTASRRTAPAAFETPMGVVPIDEDARRRLMRSTSVVHEHDAAHAREHSLEMQLPFLQRCAPELPILPLVMGHQDRRDSAGARPTGSPRRCAVASRLLVASTDLSHYHDGQCGRASRRRRDRPRDAFDADGLQAALDANPDHACGGGPMVAVMRAARRSGPRRGRCSATPIRATSPATSRRSSATGWRDRTFSVTSARRQARLLRIARDAIDGARDRRRRRQTRRGIAASRRGGGVCHPSRGGELRGCIGHLDADDLLVTVVGAMRGGRQQCRPEIPADWRRRAPRSSKSSCRCLVRLEAHRRSRGPRDRPARPADRARATARSAAAASRRRMEVGRGDISRPDVPQGRPPGGQMAERRDRLAVRSGSVLRESLTEPLVDHASIRIHAHGRLEQPRSAEPLIQGQACGKPHVDPTHGRDPGFRIQRRSRGGKPRESEEYLRNRCGCRRMHGRPPDIRVTHRHTPRRLALLRWSSHPRIQDVDVMHFVRVRELGNQAPPERRKKCRHGGDFDRHRLPVNEDEGGGVVSTARGQTANSA